MTHAAWFIPSEPLQQGKIPGNSGYLYENFSEKQPVLSAQLLYPLITKESFKRIFDARLFDSGDVELSNSVGKGEYGQGKVAFLTPVKYIF